MRNVIAWNGELEVPPIGTQCAKVYHLSPLLPNSGLGLAQTFD